MHATERERRKKGREKKVGKKVEPKPLLSFLFSHFPLVSCVPCLSPSHSLHTLLPLFSLSLTPQRNPVSPLGLELFEGDPELYCSLPLLPLLSSLPLPPSLHLPSTLHTPLPPLRPQGAWIPLNQEQPCSKSRPGLSTPATGLAGCPTAPQRDTEVAGLGRQEQGGDETRRNKGGVFGHIHVQHFRQRDYEGDPSDSTKKK